MMKIEKAAPLILAVIGIATATPATAGPAFVGVAVGYQASGAPLGLTFVGSTAQGAQQGAMQSCQARLSACAPAGTSTQCIGIAIGNGVRWETAEGPDKGTAETNARAKLVEVVSGLPLPELHLDPSTTAACPWG
jgi:hypothetical protein